MGSIDIIKPLTQQDQKIFWNDDHRTRGCCAVLCTSPLCFSFLGHWLRWQYSEVQTQQCVHSASLASAVHGNLLSTSIWIDKWYDNNFKYYIHFLIDYSLKLNQLLDDEAHLLNFKNNKSESLICFCTFCTLVIFSFILKVKTEIANSSALKSLSFSIHFSKTSKLFSLQFFQKIFIDGVLRLITALMKQPFAKKLWRRCNLCVFRWKKQNIPNWCKKLLRKCLAWKVALFTICNYSSSLCSITTDTGSDLKLAK